MMVLDKIPGPKIFTQRDVRETPASSATATSLSVVDATYVTLSNNSDLTAERVLTAGEGIDISDGGANNTVTVSGGIPPHKTAAFRYTRCCAAPISPLPPSPSFP